MQDYPDTNAFIPKKENFFYHIIHRINFGEIIGKYIIPGENHVTEKDIPPEGSSTCLNPEPVCDTPTSDFSGSVTLERLIDETDEMSHLNQLVLLHVDRNGGFTTHEAYFSLVQPILTLLEREIRIKYWPGMTKKDMKLVVQDWIDCEIAALQKR